jgi:hypothetical protein
VFSQVMVQGFVSAFVEFATVRLPEIFIQALIDVMCDIITCLPRSFRARALLLLLLLPPEHLPHMAGTRSSSPSWGARRGRRPRRIA